MQVGFFFWPYSLDLCERLAERADRYGYAMIGIADTPGNAMDPWVSAAMVARASQRARVAISVTNLLTRHPAVSAAAIASLDHVSDGRAVLGIGAGHSGTRNVGLAKSRANELAAGVTFHYFMPTLYHCKMMIVDDIFVTLGSVNFDNRSFSINDEVNINVIDPATARAFQESYRDDLAKSTPLTLAMFRHRPFYIKWADYFCGQFRMFF